MNSTQSHKTYLERYQQDLEPGKNDANERRDEAGKRKDWERQNREESLNGDNYLSTREGKSALSRRMSGNDGRPDLFTPSILDPDLIATVAKDKTEFQKAVNGANGSVPNVNQGASSANAKAAASRVSEIIAKAGSGVAFEGQNLGVGGLDDVLVQIKRRIWTPLAAPPQLLNGKYQQL